MAISINPITYVITVPQADLTFVSGTLYNHDTNAFRLELKSWEDSADGMVHPKTHNHNTEITIAGTTFARTIEILPPYSVKYEPGIYTVRLIGSNNNIFDVGSGILIQNSVQVIPGNSAGLQTVSSGSGLSVDEALKLKKIWQALALDATNPVTDTATATTFDDVVIQRVGDPEVSIVSTRQ